MKRAVLPAFLIIFFSSAAYGDLRGEASLSVVAVGDIIMGTTYPADILPPNDGTGMFNQGRAMLGQGDLVFGNLEGPLLDGGTPGKCGKRKEGRDKCYEFRMPTRYGRHLKEAGFNVMSIANNHAIDFGAEGLEKTIETLLSLEIQPAGGIRAASLRVRNRRVAVLGFSYIARSPYSFSLLDLPLAKNIVSQAKSRNDIVVVSFHGGTEGREARYIDNSDETYLGEKRGNPLKFSRAVVDAGADLVLGHGPHVPRAFEVYKGKLIAYSLGNFLTYGMMNLKGPSGTGYVLKADLDPATGAFKMGNIFSMELRNRGIPHVDPNRKALAMIRSLTERMAKGQRPAIDDDGNVYPPR